MFEQFPSYQVIGSKAYKPTLDNTLKLAEFIGNPQNNLRFIHVAGSNGKGSVSAMLASILQEAGYKVGLFTSPHIVDFRERIRVNGECISENGVVEFIQQIKNHSFDFSPSFFEVTFTMALDHFKKSDCDICVIETGLGGRLDSTNIISPLLSVITSISLEHTNILGDTIEAIATEKGGIIKKNTPLVIGKLPSEAESVLKEMAFNKNAEVHNSTAVDSSGYTLPLLGTYQQQNLKTALKSCEVLCENEFTLTRTAIQHGLNNIAKNTGFRGRLEVVGNSPLVILDVSHNPDGMKESLATVSELNQGRLHIVYATSNDKDVSQIVQLFPKDAHFYFCEFKNSRHMKIEDLKNTVAPINLTNQQFLSSSKLALQTAKSLADSEDTILVIGSFFLITDFL